ncbi:MAG: chromosome partitioning protein ParA [Oscillospiraceae bacterium]|jgi:MinD-like ATPase involved in chromosome partitioning or flagellar assembly|nr:chromosome partitioning protein ParA [Oscillospiraceae bacterium]
MKIKLAILDGDAGYLERLSSHFAARYAGRLEVYAFTGWEAARECFANTRIDVFLAGESFDIHDGMVPKRCGFAYLTNSPGAAAVSGARAVCKYQKAEALYRQVLEIFDSACGLADGGGGAGIGTRVVVFTAASGGTGCSTAAAACAMCLSRAGHAALYLNLEPLGDSGAFFTGDGQSDFSDVIFAIKSGTANLPLKLEIGARRDSSGVFFFAPPRTALDLLELDEGDIDELMARLRDSGAYEYVVADAPLSAGRPAMRLLRHAQAAVFVSDGSRMSNGKLAAAMRVLEIMENREDGARVPPAYIFYNKYSGKTSSSDSYEGVRVLGGAPRYEGADTGRIARILSESGAFDALAEEAEESRTAGARRGQYGV